MERVTGEAPGYIAICYFIVTKNVTSVTFAESFLLEKKSKSVENAATSIFLKKFVSRQIFFELTELIKFYI